MSFILFLKYHRLWSVSGIVLVVLSLCVLQDEMGFYRTSYPIPGADFRVFFEEGVEGTVFTAVHGPRVRNVINGLPHGGRPSPGFRNFTLIGLLHSTEIKNAFVLGFGTGTVTETLLSYTDVEEITLAEINSTLLRNLKKVDELRAIIENERVTTLVGDGRQMLKNLDRKYDFIIMDPLRSTTAYSSNLYSKEFFTVAKNSLSANGILVVFADENVVIPNTIKSVFPFIRRFPRIILASHNKLKENFDSKTFAQQPPETKIALNEILDQELQQEERGQGPMITDLRPICEYYIGYAAHL